MAKGNPPLVWFPSAEPRLGIHPSVALWKDKGVSPLRRRPTLRALDQRRLLEKAGENFCADIAVKSPTNQNLKPLAGVRDGA